MKTLTFDEMHDIQDSHESIVVNGSEGKHTYFVEIENYYRGVKIKGMKTVFFADNKEMANSKISWFTDGNVNDFLPSYIEETAKQTGKSVDDIKSTMTYLKSYGRIYAVIKGMDKDKFIVTFQEKIAGKLPK